MEYKIGIIGLGNVRLLLARLYATRHPAMGLDINGQRAEEPNAGVNNTLEVDSDILKAVLSNELISARL